MKTVNEAQEEAILRACMDQLEARTRVKAEVGADPSAPDTYLVRLRTNPEIRLVAVLRHHRQLIEDQVRHITVVAKDLLRNSQANIWGILFLAPWIPESWAKILKEKGVYFVDTVGNMWLSIDRPRVVVDIQGNKPKERPKADPGRVIEPSGLKIIHLLLSDPTCLTNPYRTIASQAGVSLSTVSIVLRELARAGHLSGHRNRLENMPALVDLFVRGYALKLRPELMIGRFRHSMRDIDALTTHLREVLKSAGGTWALAGAAGAGILTRHLQTDHLSIFVDELSETALRTERLLPDTKEGNLTLFRLFAPSAVATSDANYLPPTASPLLIYAELLQDGRPREMETAELIRPLILPGKEEPRGS